MKPIKFCDKHNCDKVYLSSKRWHCKLCANEWRAIWSKSIDQRHKDVLRQKKYDKKYPDKKRDRQIKYRKNNREKENLRIRLWIKNNPDFNKKRQIKECAGLTDCYVKTRLKSTGIKNPTPEIIEQKRLQLKITRKIKQIENETRKTITL